jgi:hypothetical protein
MTTTRRPTRRPPQSRISPAAIEIFRTMQAIECTCPDYEIDWEGEYWKRPEPCPGCLRWRQAHHDLHCELQLRPWWYPVFDYPDAECPYPTGCPAALHWRRERDEHPERLQLYHALVEAAERHKEPA